MKPTDYFENMAHDRRDPNPFLAVFLDQSVPFNKEAKAAFLKDASSKPRQFMLPLLRPFAKLAIIAIQVLKVFVPNKFTSSKYLHLLLYWLMKTWLSPEANYLILRHFYLGSEVLGFIKDNVEGAEVQMNPLKPIDLTPIKDDLFLLHDLNLYNFVIALNREIEQKGLKIEPKEKLNLDSITETPIPVVLENLPNKWTNFVDLTTAIECFTPIYQLFLTDNDFWRATNSLQLDETIGIYAAKIGNMPDRLALLNNKHPMVPAITLQAGYRLMLHGLATEQLHALLVQRKEKAAAEKILKIE